jgi:hypothetical protein
MARYMILVYQRELPLDAEDVPPEVMEAHMWLPKRVEESGGKILYGHGALPVSTATSIRGDVVTEGPFIDSGEAFAGFFVVEATDLYHAVSIGRMVPVVDGGVEVRPLISA